MPLQYDLMTSGISSISVDGHEHKIDPETGYLVVEVLTPNIEAELARRGAKRIDPGVPKTAGSTGLAPLTDAERNERDTLFIELDAATDKRIDRRKSLQQLREMKADLAEKAAMKADV